MMSAAFVQGGVNLAHQDGSRETGHNGKTKFSCALASYVGETC